MPTIQVTISDQLAEALDYLIKKGYARTPEEAIQKAIVYLAKEETAEEIMEAEIHAKNGQNTKLNQ